MNPSNNDSQTPFGIGAIPPVDDQLAGGSNGMSQQQADAASHEQAAMPHTALSAASGPVSSALADIPGLASPTANAVGNSQAPLAPQSSGSASQHSPKIAEDVDLIEKEWVIKAKAIISSTRGNPNEQSKELSRFKADYLKARYSKDLKVDDK